MALYDFGAPRLHVGDDLRAGGLVALDRTASHYLLTVLRLGPAGEVLVFNGRDGEWLARVAQAERKAATLELVRQVRAQTAASDLVYLFAPLKHARLDYGVQKAVEMGVGSLQPVLTRRTVATRVNRDRMRANAIEAAEQCGILSIPAILPEAKLDAAIGALAPERMLVLCDEDAPVANPLDALRGMGPGRPCALLIGPEGGFAPEERAVLLARENVVRLSLGPRILRADTAAVAALAIVQATIGDWG